MKGKIICDPKDITRPLTLQTAAAGIVRKGAVISLHRTAYPPVLG